LGRRLSAALCALDELNDRTGIHDNLFRLSYFAQISDRRKRKIYLTRGARLAPPSGVERYQFTISGRISC
jgi:hypothetical protein